MLALPHTVPLFGTLIEARDAKELGRHQRRLNRVDVLIVDDAEEAAAEQE